MSRWFDAIELLSGFPLSSWLCPGTIGAPVASAFCLNRSTTAVNELFLDILANLASCLDDDTPDDTLNDDVGPDNDELDDTDDEDETPDFEISKNQINE